MNLITDKVIGTRDTIPESLIFRYKKMSTKSRKIKKALKILVLVNTLYYRYRKGKWGYNPRILQIKATGKSKNPEYNCFSWVASLKTN